MQVVILAGGKGTRLKHLTESIPKPMIPVAGKPLLLHQVELCKKYGFTHITILVNHLKEPIISFFGDGSAFGVSINYYEEKVPLGTVGGIKAIENDLKEDFLVLYGDVMINMHLQKFWDFHKSKKSECTLALHPNDHPYDSDLVDMDKNCRVTEFFPKPHQEGKYYRNLVNAGAYIFSPAIFKYLEKDKKADFGREVFPAIYNDISMFGYNTSEYLKDMGTPDRLDKVEADVKSGLVEHRSYDYRQKAIFLDRDGVINPDKHLIFRPDEMELYPFAANAIKKINQSPFLTLVATNQSVVARNLCTEAELAKVHDKMETLLGNEKAKVDGIYYCPHHPDRGFPEENKEYKIECNCRKPKPGMLLNGAEDFNVNLNESYFIGDSERDIIAGIEAGVTTIGVKTGKGLKDSKTEPDYFFRDLGQAVDFIVDEPYKNLAEDVLGKVKTSNKKPFVISVAGNSRSGKSTLSTYLYKYLKNSNLSVFKIELDDWILAKEDRPKNANVFDNFQFEKMVNDLEKIIKGEKVKAIGYARHPKRKPQPKNYEYNGEEVIVIEGIIAIGSEKLRELSDFKIFKKIEMNQLKKRIEEFYGWKGFTGKEIDQLFLERNPIEYELIEQHEAFADLVVGF